MEEWGQVGASSHVKVTQVTQASEICLVRIHKLNVNNKSLPISIQQHILYMHVDIQVTITIQVTNGLHFSHGFKLDNCGLVHFPRILHLQLHYLAS